MFDGIESVLCESIVVEREYNKETKSILKLKAGSFPCFVTLYTNKVHLMHHFFEFVNYCKNVTDYGS